MITGKVLDIPEGYVRGNDIVRPIDIGRLIGLIFFAHFLVFTGKISAEPT